MLQLPPKCVPSLLKLPVFLVTNFVLSLLNKEPLTTERDCYLTCPLSSRGKDLLKCGFSV
jgi:hypothetical protein